jgi:TolB protein
MNEDGSDQTMIAETTRGGSLTWSPDGTKLAFYDVGGIYTINADGSGERRVPTTTGSDQWPSWSPDGTRLAVRNGEGTDGIDIVNVDGSGRRRLVIGRSGWPAWSPDGTRIAYSAGRELHVVNADGGGRRKLTHGGFDDAPSWSPDGRSIAYRHNDTIAVITVDGGDPRPLASPGGTALANPNGQGANKLAAGRGSPATPQWSPDGRKIVYALYLTGEACSIWIMNADGSGQTPLTDSRTCDHDPAWQPIP